MQQGGGGENLLKGKRIVQHFISRELIRSAEKLKVTNQECIGVIPTQQQVRDAIAHLEQEQEKTPEQFIYIKFPFGLLDNAGLKDIEKYHIDIELKHLTNE